MFSRYRFTISAMIMFSAVAGISLARGQAGGQAKPAGGFRSVSDLQASHDRLLVRDLLEYAERKPQPEDVDQAYMALFNKVIEHDWFAEHEAVAKRYLDSFPEGPVRPLAQIVATMSRAQAGKYGEALAVYEELMRGVASVEQVEFARSFAESLADTAIRAGEHDVARKVYSTLLKKFGDDDPNLKQRVAEEFAKLDRVGKPAPSVPVKDVDGRPFRLEDMRGKYLLVDFWATWCAPCVTDLPNLTEARAKYQARGFEIVSISLDDSKAALTDFVRTRKIPWKQIHNATCEGDMIGAFGVGAIPATFLIDPQGKIIRLDLRGGALDATLTSLLK